VTGSRLDLLSPGDELQEIPAGIIAMNWGPDVYRDTPLAFYHRADQTVAEADLLDFQLTITDSQEGVASFSISNEDITWRGRFVLDGDDLLIPETDHEPDLTVHTHNEDIPIGEYLNEVLPEFYSSDLSMIEGTSIFATPEELDPVGNEAFEVVNWAAANVDITKEKPDGAGQRSIFEWLEERLVASAAGVVFCDDGSGEIADFIAIETAANNPRVKFYHCKASRRAQPGRRVQDLYEVCGQVVKSSMWTKTETLVARMRHRAGLRGIRGYLKGDEAGTNNLLTAQMRQQVQFEIYLVQPGVTRDNREEPISHILAATKHYIVQGGVDIFGVIGS
jgi:hypothetical protein